MRNVCGRVRLIRVLGVLRLYATLVKRDFDTLGKPEVESLVSMLLARKPPYSAETMGTYKAILKNFMTWVLAPDRFPTSTDVPAAVSWLTCHVRKRDKRRLERNELLTPADIERLISVAPNTRDKALLATLWETGARVAEEGNLQLKSITKVPQGYTLALSGKTGQRNVLIVSSAPYLTIWLAEHPFKHNPESPLWIHLYPSETPQHLRYCTLRLLLQRYFKRAGITKPYHPHIFRHSRATYVLASGVMNEQQAKAYFGWTPNSNMLGTYSHLIDQDANNAILRENNLTPIQIKAQELKPIACAVCKELNPAKSEYCMKCGAVLNLTKAYEHQTLHDLKDDLFGKLFRVLVERGLVDEAAREIHDAHLGETLKRLALHASGERSITIDAPHTAPCADPPLAVQQTPQQPVSPNTSVVTPPSVVRAPPTAAASRSVDPAAQLGSVSPVAPG